MEKYCLTKKLRIKEILRHHPTSTLEANRLRPFSLIDIRRTAIGGKIDNLEYSKKHDIWKTGQMEI